MSNALTAFGIAIGGTSLIYLLATRRQGRRRHRSRTRDGAGSDGSYFAGDSASHFGWSGTDQTASGQCAGSDDTGGTGSTGAFEGCASGGGDGGGGDGGGGDGGVGGGSD
jgi:hypothetical protein